MLPSAPDNLLLDQFWYHTIELLPGVYSPGQSYFNIAAPRDLLKHCEVKGARCLDIGAMEGLFSVLLARRQAAEVFATDRYDRQANINVVKTALDVDFSYLPNLTLNQVRQKLPLLTPKGALDLIVFSGVLYHMYDPMPGLALVRSMLRNGGLLVIETNAIVSKTMTGYFNAGGRIVNDCHNYWTFSVTLLDYLLRYFRLSALDCRYVDMPPGHALAEDGCKLVRLGVVCRAVDSPLPEQGDDWMIASRDEDAEYPDWDAAERNLPPLGYAAPATEFLRASGSVDLYQMVSNTPSLRYGQSEVTLSRNQLY